MFVLVVSGCHKGRADERSHDEKKESSEADSEDEEVVIPRMDLGMHRDVAGSRVCGSECVGVNE